MQGHTHTQKKAALSHSTVNVKARREQAVSKSCLQKLDGAGYSGWAIVRKPLIIPEKYMSVSEVVQTIEAVV